MKKSRKKILLSSIAMLLVALVALGSATFAWFTINKSVSADTMKVTANVADGLIITNLQTHNDKDAHWGRTAHFNSDAESLNPVSFNVATVGTSVLTGGTTVGYYPNDVKTDAAWDGTDTNKGSWADQTLVSNSSYSDSTKAMNFDNYSAAYKFWVASSGDPISGNVSASISAATITDGEDASTFAKAALCDSTGKVIGFYNNGGYTAIKKTVNQETTTYGLEASAAAGNAVDNISAISGTVPAWNGTGANAPKEFTLYVWFEGQDPQCANTAQGYGVNFTVDFDLTLA